MKFERARNGHRTATFEIDQDTKYHEHVVAVNALGTLTATTRSDREMRLHSARLGVRLGGIQYAGERDDGREFTPSRTKLTKDEASVLDTALTTFVVDTPEAVRGLLAIGNAPACNTRTVEAELASSMQEDLRAEFIDLPSIPANSVGFR